MQNAGWLSGCIVKNFRQSFSSVNGHVQRKISAAAKILRRRQACELPEFMNQMCLIIVSALHRKVRPIGCCCGTISGSESFLKTENSRGQLRRHAHAAIETGKHLLMTQSQA